MYIILTIVKNVMCILMKFDVKRNLMYEALYGAILCKSDFALYYYKPSYRHNDALSFTIRQAK